MYGILCWSSIEDEKNIKGNCFFNFDNCNSVADWYRFGNAFPSNIENQAWTGFLGSYLGGIATLVAVFITISDNNKKIEEQKRIEKEQLAGQKKVCG